MYSFEEKKLCECGAELESENIVMTSFPPQYPYTCPKCHRRFIYRADGTRWEWDTDAKSYIEFHK